MSQHMSAPVLDKSNSEFYTHGWFAQTWQLVLWNLYHLRRRLMTRILLGIFFGGYALLLLITILSHILLGNNHGPTIGADPIMALVFPGSLQFMLGYLGLLAPIFLCIIAGALIGGDYGYGLHRQMLTRGLSRAQVFTAQVLALSLLVLGFVGIAILLSILLGMLIGPLFGIAPTLLPLNGWLGVVLTWLTQSVRYFLYMLIAVLAATIGRSVLAGIAFSIGYVFVEFLATTILFSLVGGLSVTVGNAIVSFVSNLPGVVTNTLNSYSTAVIVGQPIASLSELPWQIFLTVAYCAILIAVSYFVYSRSDIFD
ncbi:hypothetical protein KDA_61410 [Dictyobacter alpinus]|uniref:ABC transporter permease n=1 Tax=Dictyobacter alpinus TaxID=2014873 RepID=A0A402BHD0_9CHLR|nr:hypothetical protein [Dictyobacter alpinus]GCE30657.1 hypothetical protein KDA_61410 [Dictyobacter alpinus]